MRRKSLWRDRTRNRESRRKAASERELVPHEWNTGSISVTEKLVLPLWTKLFWPLTSYLACLWQAYEKRFFLFIPSLIHSLSFRAANDLAKTIQRDKTETEACSTLLTFCNWNAKLLENLTVAFQISKNIRHYNFICKF